MQGSVLGLLLITLNMLPFGEETQSEFSFLCRCHKAVHTYLLKQGLLQLPKTEGYLAEVTSWMVSNFLLLNPDKAELLLLGPRIAQGVVDRINLGGCLVNVSTVVKILTVSILDAHINNLVKTAFFHMRNIAKLRKMLLLQDAEKLEHAFITSILD